MTWPRVATVAEIQGRSLLRRRLALAFLIALPSVFYLSVAGEEATLLPGEPPWPLNVGVVGVGWAIAGGSFFLSISSRRVDERLVIAGYRPTELATGRLLFLAVLAAPIVVAYSLLITLLSDASTGPLVLAILLTGVVAVALGLTVASLLPRELEGFLLLLSVIGVQSSLHEPVAALPFYGPLRVVVASWEPHVGLVGPVVHALGATAVLLTLALVAWRRRLGMYVTRPISDPGAAAAGASAHLPLGGRSRRGRPGACGPRR